MGKSENSGFFQKLAASDLKVGRVLKVKAIFYHIFSRFCTFCALQGRYIR